MKEMHKENFPPLLEDLPPTTSPQTEEKNGKSYPFQQSFGFFNLFTPCPQRQHQAAAKGQC